MPIYKANEMKLTADVVRPHIQVVQYGGELIKAGLVTYKKGDVPPPHVHHNDEQWIYLLSGKLAVLLNDDISTAEAGDLIYIPRNTIHGIRVLDDECRFFTCKSPAGSGGLSEDYTSIPNLEELLEKLKKYN
tara:strand:+ start:1654 stop:2049 length:396 start_codon:yes stop_codon:yes gene_type:complete